MFNKSKQYLSDLLAKAKASIPSILSSLKESSIQLMTATLVLSLGYVALNGQDMHRLYLRAHVGSRVVKVVRLDAEGNIRGGGTGFQVKAPSGKNYILTNDHVCDAFKDLGYIYIQPQSGRIYPRKILEKSEVTDLCLVEGMEGVEGLTLADDVNVGDKLNIVGHPRLKPLAVMSGELLGSKYIQVMLGPIKDGKWIQEGLDEQDCKKPKHVIEEVDMMFFSVRVCTEKILANETTIVSLPGNSGSPVVNGWGNVVGVLFAGDNEVHWGDLVSLSDIKNFIKPY